MDEKLVGSLGEAASKVIESRGHAVKDSTMGVGNMFHGILGGIGGTIQWCIILQIILVVVYINCSALLKLCQQKMSYPANQTTNSLINPLISTTTSPPKLSTNSHSAQNRLDIPTPTQSFTLGTCKFHSPSCFCITREVIPIIILSQIGHISCSALMGTVSPVTLLSEKSQHQLNLPATPLYSPYHLVGTTGNSLTTLGSAQVDIMLDHKTWPTLAIVVSSLLAIVVSSLAHPLILGLNFLKLSKSKIDVAMNNVEIRSKAYPSDIVLKSLTLPI